MSTSGSMSVTSSASSVLEVSIAGGVARLSLNRPEKRNALNGELLAALLLALDDAGKNADVKVVVLNASQPAAFCVGADLSGAKDLAQAAAEQKLYAELLKRIRTYSKTTVALVEGLCLGGGLGVALACDLVYASKSAVFGTPEVQIGLYPLMISPLIYENCKSRKRADQIILSGGKLSADEAFDVGFATAVAADSEFRTFSEEKLAQLLKADSAAIVFGKKAVRDASALPFESEIDTLCGSLGELLSKPQTRARIAAFLAKG